MSNDMRLVILLPSNGKVHTKFLLSLIGLTQALAKRRIPFSIKNYEFSDIMMSRNYLVSYFLSKPDFTHALLLDSDLVFDPQQFFRLAEFKEDFTAATYADRRITDVVIREAIKETPAELWDKPNAVQTILARHMRYLHTVNSGERPEFKPRRRKDFQTVVTAATGFMLISRNVVETMAERGVAKPLTRTGKLPIYQDAPRFSDFFSHEKTKEGDAFYGEDQSFCRRWRMQCDGDIWVDLKSQVSHIGEFTYHGDYRYQAALMDYI